MFGGLQLLGKKGNKPDLHQGDAQPLVTFFASWDIKSYSASLAVIKDSVCGEQFILFDAFSVTKAMTAS